MAAHADPDHRDLGDVGGTVDAVVPTVLEHDQIGRAMVVGSGNGECQSVLAPSPETFCTIMSTLILASASGPKIATAMPGLSCGGSDLCLVL